MRKPADRLAELFAQLEAEPARHDFYQVLRQIEACTPERPRFGETLRPGEEPVRLGQEPSMAFAPAAISHFDPGHDRRKPRLDQRFFGFLGPNGPMPLHMTELAVQRLRHHGDPTLARFLDVMHHRWLSLFYRIWAQASPTASLDRPDQDRFSSYVGALAGYGTAGVRRRDSVPDVAKQFFAGILARGARSTEGLAGIVSTFFGVPARVEEFVGHWMPLQPEDRTRLGQRREANRLGRGATAGSRVWDRQHKVRLVLGPMPLTKYEDLLPSGTAGAQLRHWLLNYFGHGMGCEIQLLLAQGEVPRTALKKYGALGWSTWIGQRRGREAAGDLVLQTERLARA